MSWWLAGCELANAPEAASAPLFVTTALARLGNTGDAFTASEDQDGRTITR